MPNLTTGCPATAVRFGSRLAPPDGQHLTGQKGLGQPLRTRPLAVYFFLRSAVCELRPAKFPSLPVIILAIVVLVIVILAVVIGVIPIPVVIAFDPFLFFVPFVEFVQDKVCADG